MKRRTFILVGTAGIAAVSIPASYYFLSDFHYDKSLAEPQSLSLIWDSETIASAGKQYSIQTPGETTERRLARTLLAGVSDADGDLKASLEEKILKDFETGNIVIVDGWILSETEARQCALFSINEQKK